MSINGGLDGFVRANTADTALNRKLSAGDVGVYRFLGCAKMAERKVGVYVRIKAVKVYHGGRGDTETRRG